ncbi:ankyrin [Acephala macrosclerotiorum]|nr:ankyrin [Acephala macrosclerotiorum]
MAHNWTYGYQQAFPSFSYTPLMGAEQNISSWPYMTQMMQRPFVPKQVPPPQVNYQRMPTTPSPNMPQFVPQQGPPSHINFQHTLPNPNRPQCVPQQVSPAQNNLQYMPPTPPPDKLPFVAQRPPPAQKNSQHKQPMPRSDIPPSVAQQVPSKHSKSKRTPPQTKPRVRYVRTADGDIRSRVWSEMQAAIESNDSNRILQILDQWDRARKLLNSGLNYAIETGSVALVKLFLEQGAPISDNIVESAVMSRSLAVFELLFEHGWRPNDPYYSWAGRSSRMVLTECLDNKKLTEWLLEKGGADSNLGAPLWGDSHSVPISNSPEALNRAAELADIPVFELLINHKAKIENCCALHFAAASRQKPALTMMAYLKKKLPINGLDHVRGPYAFGTPLHYAVRSSNIENIKWLLRHGADPFLSNTAGQSAYEEAVKMKYEEAVDLFDKRRREKLSEKKLKRRESI